MKAGHIPKLGGWTPIGGTIPAMNFTGCAYLCPPGTIGLAADLTSAVPPHVNAAALDAPTCVFSDSQRRASTVSDAGASTDVYELPQSTPPQSPQQPGSRCGTSKPNV